MVESRIEAIRAAKRGEGQSLTQRQALALAGEWYVWYVARHEENPGPVEHWRSMWDALIFHMEEHAPDWVIEEGWRDLERKIAATRAAENGATVAQLNAIFGWKGTAMASLYTEAAERKRLAAEAMPKVQSANETATIPPVPNRKVRGRAPKAN